MRNLEDLEMIAERFCGAILFNGGGSALVVGASQAFNFETLSACEVGSDEKVTFEDVGCIDLEYFSFEDLPYNVKDPDIVEATIIRELNSLNKVQKRQLLTKLKEL